MTKNESEATMINGSPDGQTLFDQPKAPAPDEMATQYPARPANTRNTLAPPAHDEGATINKPSGTGPVPVFANTPASTPKPNTQTGVSNTKAPSGQTNVPQGTQIPARDERNTDQYGGGGKAKPPEAGDHVNHYELIRLLGKGGMGSVFLARDNKLGRRVAIKFLHTQDPEMTKRFILEARTTARFSHENIVTIYEVDQHNGQPFMVLEYLQGQPLTKLLPADKPMPPARAVELMVPVVRALASAHAEGIVHRDLKFDNVFVTESGTIKVLDFGIAKVLGAAGEEQAQQEPAPEEPRVDTQVGANPLMNGQEITDLTRHGTIMGTLAFMSPEQWKGHAVDHRTDIWAAGIMLFRMLAGHHPLHPLTGMALSVTGRMKDPMPSLKEHVPELPDELIKVIDGCLKKPRDERWPDALAFLRGLEPFLPGRYTRELKIDESPYTGLSSFQESDADRFFGRAHEVAALVTRLRDTALVGVVGPSGAGKSSFVRAGVVPALKRGGENWESVVIRPGRNPLQALASVLAPLVSTSTSIADDMEAQKKLVARLAAEPGYAGSVLRSRARREKKHILLFIDQFEELYTLVPDAQERLAFTACLSSVADDPTSPTRVVLSIRSDFLDRVTEDQAFVNELTRGLFFLATPGSDGLRDALVQPAEMAGYRFDSEEIVTDMLRHLESTSGALPLLQFAATKLWEGRDPAKKALTKASYEAIGGIAGALASHADSVLKDMAPGARTLVRAIFMRLVTPDRTRAIVSVDELRELAKDGNEVQRLVDQLVQARLLVVQTGGGGSGATAEIVHESLIHSWPTLRRWLDESGEDAAFLDQLRNAARQWQQKGRDAGLLWRGEVVQEAERFSRRYRGELPQVQRDFLEAVFSQQVKSARRQRMLTAGATGLAGVIAIASVVALLVIRNAEQEAQHQAVAAKSAERLATDAAAKAREAEGEAKQRLVEVQAKERERAAAAAAAEEASRKVQDALKQVSAKNAALNEALERAEHERQKAKRAQKGAEQSAAEAKRAQLAVAQANAELERAIQSERERNENLRKQLGGSTVIDTLK